MNVQVPAGLAQLTFSIAPQTAPAGAAVTTDALGDNSLATESSTDTWESNTTCGFGYSVADVSGTAAFNSAYKQFADNSSAEVAPGVMATPGR